ncbi:hypothetical protein RM549_01290 [Salegentibacter sp. F188]|uniref:Uncharacterized protein n=1 Tax=Autumnicola patrickiae TaxID=3075591 RepID=A0ABU3DXF3_9FLAO|nr:hypothetical protein [Salegentibacter sp. F188]MDT0688401.1 hypothetical protein [Salegentibacter sp. F188]
MKKYISFLVVTFFIICSFSCSNDDDVTEEETARYDLVVNNETESEIVIYINNTADTRGFVNNGMIDAGGEAIVIDLEAEAPYLLRAVNSGEDLEDFFFELPFSYEESEGPTIIINSPQL